MIYFLEREENVKSDIFLAYRALLHITKPIAAAHTSSSDVVVMDTPDRYMYM